MKNMKSLNSSEKNQLRGDGLSSGMEADLDIDLREVYFLIMHFLSIGPCQRTFGQFWNELLEHDLLPRRYHAWYSRSGIPTGDDDDNGLSYPLSYNKLVERYPHIGKDHLVKLLKQLILSKSQTSNSVAGGNAPNAADVPTLLGRGPFSLLGADENERSNDIKPPSLYMRWPHMRADQVRGLRLREVGGFRRQHRSPAVHTACYAIAKPSMMVEKMQHLVKLRGHRNAVYCATYDRSGRFVITGSDDRLVKIWCMETAHCLASCRGHEGDITDLAVSSNNALVASASNDYVIRVWRLPDGLPISVLRGHTGGVTGIVFSPRPSAVYQLLSAADDGTCRLWDARYSQFKPRIFFPKPSENVAGKNGAPSSSSAQQNLQIFCCTFNASGTIFVTGSSDFNARVWNAYKSSTDDSEQPIHEMDVLSGHENDVNYVQFSGCAVGSRVFTAETIKEDNMPKFKNSWLAHDNIVTCSRDGSAIIWIPKSRRSHGKAGRWTRAYHLKVPPPPMPPQSLRGGPRQRVPPTPRGVNMIIWSLDNRFVLAAIMDCRICVWNAADGSLVHSLTGHTEFTYVLDVHPFNPRMAMSAGYDGKTIIWDIWEGKPIQIYETGRFKLVDGKFSPDGTSIILSDDVGQLYILSTGQGESQKDAQYDQFFLGDYRPLIQDTHGNVVDQETQLAPYRRNMQDLLCDSSMIPYPEPYQSMYQRRRLGTLGIEWRPSSVRFAVGPDFNTDQDFLIPSLADMDMPIDPLPEFTIDWEPEIEIVSDDSDSEFSVTEEFCVREDEVDLSPTSSDGSEGSAEYSEEDDTPRDFVRRSKRKKRRRETEITTSSGRRVKRKILDKYDDSLHRSTPSRKLVNGPRRTKKNSSSKSSRPRRAAARNALTLFSKIKGKNVEEREEDYGSEGDSESASELLEFLSDTEESDYVSDDQIKNSKGKEVIVKDSEDLIRPWDFRVPRENSGNKKRLLLKLPVRDRSKISIIDGSYGKDQNVTNFVGSSSSAPHGDGTAYRDGSQPHHTRNDGERSCNFPAGYMDGKIKWGGVKLRTSKLLKSTEHVSSNADLAPANFHSLNKIKHEEAHINPSSQSPHALEDNKDEANQVSDEGMHHIGVGNLAHLNDLKGFCGSDDSLKHSTVVGDKSAFLAIDDEVKPNGLSVLKLDGNGIAKRLEIWTNGTMRDPCTAEELKMKPSMQDKETCSIPEQTSNGDKVPEEDNGNNHAGLSNGAVKGMVKAEASTNGNSGNSPLNLSMHSQKSDRMYSAVYKRSKCRARESSETNGHSRNSPSHGTSSMNGSQNDEHMTCSPVQEGNQQVPDHTNARSAEASCSTEDALLNKCNLTPSREWGAGLTVGLRSARNRRRRIIDREPSPVAVFKRRSNQSLKKVSWLMLSMQEGFRYIPQQGDEVVYLRQGHQEYMSCGGSSERGPWQYSKAEIRAVEFCKVIDLNYSTLPGSGESCCKMALEFVDPSSEVYGTTFKLTLPEVTSFPDFLVEKTKYCASIERNWTARDKCKVWWRNEGEEDGTRWDGRIIGVKAKDPEFPDSPWERFAVRYKSEPSETHCHSPWELHDSATAMWEQPQIDEDARKKLLSALAKLERAGNGQLDRLGILKLNEASQKSNFLNRFPVPLSLDVIQARLENSYYRSVEALKHDIKVMMGNAESYFGKSADNTAKMKRLSEWFVRTLASL